MPTTSYGQGAADWPARAGAPQRRHDAFAHGVAGAVGLAAALVLAACSGGPSIEVEGGTARQAVSVSRADEAHLRAGMRGYLESLQGVLDGLAGNRLDRVATSARGAGMAAVKGVRFEMVASLPPEFTLLSVDTHERFDALARRAAERASRQEIVSLAGEILANCTACHAMFTLAPRK
jgi:hypothetical protein